MKTIKFSQTVQSLRIREFCAVLLVQMRRSARTFWRGLREWCGDAAYEQYSRASATTNSACQKLTPTEYYVEQLNRRYSRPSRCC
jgi:hypothetical protein